MGNNKSRSLTVRELAVEGCVNKLRQQIRKPTVAIAEQVLAGGAEGGHESVMRLGKMWGATNYNEALLLAAQEGHVSAMRLAIEWGATDCNGATSLAASRKQTAMCYPDGTINTTTPEGYKMAMRLAIEWGSPENTN